MPRSARASTGTRFFVVAFHCIETAKTNIGNGGETKGNWSENIFEKCHFNRTVGLTDLQRVVLRRVFCELGKGENNARD
jgi:hypothetical protein